MNIADSQIGGVPYGLHRRRKSETLRAQYIDVNELRYASFLPICFVFSRSQLVNCLFSCVNLSQVKYLLIIRSYICLYLQQDLTE